MLKTVFAALIMAAWAVPAPAALPPAPPYAMPNTEVRMLPVTSAGRHYQLYIGLPQSYAKEPGKRYPVVFVTDGYWDFAKIIMVRDGMVYDKVSPDFIVVGLGYAGDNPDYGNLRLWELSPVRMPNVGDASGHAADFLQTLKTQIIPFVDANYRTDPSYRVMAGSSLGGLFTLYTMLTAPDLFQAYVAGTPATVAGDDWLFGYEERFAKTPERLEGKRLFMTTGGNEAPAYVGGVLRFNQRLAARHYPGFDFAFRIIEGERHAGGQIEAYSRGLRYAFLPLAPETGPVTPP
jgi:predicted alpha/beta superfamily hydrolase